MDAVESYGPAVRDLRRNLEEARLDNVDAVGGDADREFPDDEANIIVVDPPRAGLAENVVRQLSDQPARAIAYVSCDPATLARDLARFREIGTYEVEERDARRPVPTDLPRGDRDAALSSLAQAPARCPKASDAFGHFLCRDTMVMRQTAHSREARMAKVAILLADGFETIEALAPADVLRRAGEDVSLVTINALPHVTTAHGIGIDCDATLDEYDFGACDLIVLPGGMPGTTNLRANERVCELTGQFMSEKRLRRRPARRRQSSPSSACSMVAWPRAIPAARAPSRPAFAPRNLASTRTTIS